MKISNSSRLLIDASVLITATRNPHGGSGAILALGKTKKFHPIITPLILQETEKNIKKKLTKKDLLKFYQQLSKWKSWIKNNPSLEEIALFNQVIDPKDSHVLAAASKHQADFLITLDKKHFFTIKIKKANFAFLIITPEKFLRIYRQQHEDNTLV